MTTELIGDNKLYELLLQDKKHKEDRRDSINSYYIVLLTGVIGILPFMRETIQASNVIDKGIITTLSSSIIEIVGFMLCIIWALSLKSILFYLEILEARIEKLEKAHNISYMTYIKQQSYLKHSPNTVIKYQVLLPYVFVGIFFSTFIYSVFQLPF